MQPVDLGIPGLTDARLLGRGGFGTVYAATEPEFGRTVAVKILRERLDDEAVRRAFTRECQAMGALSGHPHIVTVHRGGATAGGAPYIVMDLMSGGSLADRVKTGPLPWAEVLETGILLASALETAHRRGILHLDLKPANILVSRYGEPKLADFGISRLPGVAETSDTVRASPAFAAPERLADGTATVSTDLYGFGATLFTLLTGTPAFQGEAADLIVVLARIVRQPVPDLRGAGVPDPVCRVLERLMAKSPGERYATAADTATALQDAQRATGRPLTRAVIEGAPTPTEEAGAPTSLALGAVAAGASPRTATAPPDITPAAIPPDGFQADAPRPDGSRPDGSRPDGSRADGSRADGSRADGSRADGSRADGSRPDESRPDRHQAHQNRADQNRADQNRADQYQADQYRADRPWTAAEPSGSSWPDPGHVDRERPAYPPADPSATAIPPAAHPPAGSAPHGSAPHGSAPHGVSWPPADRPTWPTNGPSSTGTPAPARPSIGPGSAAPHVAAPARPAATVPATSSATGQALSARPPHGAWADPPRTLASPAPWPAAQPGRPRRRTLLWAALGTAVAAGVVVGVVALGTATGSSGTPDPTSTPPTAEEPVGAVAVAPDVTNPETGNARTLLDAYVTAINEERYEDAFALFSPDSPVASGGLDSWLAQQQPREVSDARIVAVRDDGPDGLVAVWTFRSRQDPSFSPDGLQDCLDWELSYVLAGPAPGWLIRSSSAVTDPRPC